VDADRGEEQELLAIIDKSDNSLYNLNDAESGDILCSKISLFDNSHCSIDCSHTEDSPNDLSSSDHGVNMTHTDYSLTDLFDTNV
jgi:hypothetical protein